MRWAWPESQRSCENIDFGFFGPRVFSYLQAEKSGFFNIFTASKPFRTAGGGAAANVNFGDFDATPKEHGTSGAN